MLPSPCSSAWSCAHNRLSNTCGWTVIKTYKDGEGTVAQVTSLSLPVPVWRAAVVAVAANNQPFWCDLMKLFLHYKSFICKSWLVSIGYGLFCGIITTWFWTYGPLSIRIFFFSLMHYSSLSYCCNNVQLYWREASIICKSVWGFFFFVLRFFSLFVCLFILILWYMYIIIS